MGRLLSGVLIILFLIVLNLLLAFIQTGATTADGFDQDCAGQNATACAEEAQTQSTFFDTLFGVTVAGQPFGADAPTILNVLAFVIMLTLLSTAILLIVLAFVPLTAE